MLSAERWLERMTEAWFDEEEARESEGRGPTAAQLRERVRVLANAFRDGKLERAALVFQLRGVMADIAVATMSPKPIISDKCADLLRQARLDLQLAVEASMEPQLGVGTVLQILAVVQESIHDAEALCSGQLS